MDKAAEWCRDHASELRLWAERQSDSAIRRDMLDLAHSWDLAARSHELRLRWRRYRSRVDRIERWQRNAGEG